MLGYRAVITSPAGMSSPVIQQNMSVSKETVEQWVIAVMSNLPPDTTAVIYMQVEQPMELFLRHEDTLEQMGIRHFRRPIENHFEDMRKEISARKASST